MGKRYESGEVVKLSCCTVSVFKPVDLFCLSFYLSSCIMMKTHFSWNFVTHLFA